MEIEAKLLPLLVALLAIAPAPAPAQGPERAATPPIFVERAAEVGLDFVHRNGMSGKLYFCEMMGGGGALFDVDNDGDLDVFLVQGRPLGREPKPGEDFRHRLYENDLVPGGELRFTDVTASSGLDESTGYGMGVATGDYDNDGWVDLYVTELGGNRLLRNNGGDGRPLTFTDVTAAAGVDDPAWSVSASFFDFDRDGWLDLFVVNYVNFTVASHKVCRSYTGAPDYCSPLAYRPVPDSLFRNRGDGTFEAVSAKSGIRREFGAGLGVVASDFNGDGWADLYVANDQSANQMWINQGARDDGPGDGPPVTFRNEALMAGTALNSDGRPEAGMGVAAGDVDGDGDLDLLVSHLVRETNTLYVNDGRGSFEDRTIASGLGQPSWGSTGFGLAWLDFDNDGWLDVFAANGSVKHIEELVRRDDPYPLHQPNQLFRNLGGGRFEEVTAQAGESFALSEVSRGTAVGDVDNDGDPDLLVVNNHGPVRLMINRVGQERPWLGLRLLSAEGRDALGALVAVRRPGRHALWRRVATDGSYASAGDPRVLVGLGDAGEAGDVLVVWPDGRREEWPAGGLRRYRVLQQGVGRPVGTGGGDR